MDTRVTTSRNSREQWARDLAMARLRRLTFGAAALGAVGTVALGGAAAMSYSGHATATAAAIAQTGSGSTSVSGAAATTDPTAAATAAPTAAAQQQTGPLIVSSGHHGSGLVTSGGS